MQKFPMTVHGEEALRQELNRLKTVERPRIILAIAEARAHGDLKENAEYHAAREQQSFTEGRILEIEARLNASQVINVKDIPNTGRVIFGVTVTLLNIDSEESIQYTIVGEDEANVVDGKISVTSPIARAIIGKSVDDTIDVQTPAGIVTYEIVKVEHL